MAKLKTWKARKLTFFFTKQHCKVIVFFDLGHNFGFWILVFIYYQKVKKENFPRFPSFRFWVQDKIENLETLDLFIYSY